jgi:hypothetical protein
MAVFARNLIVGLAIAGTNWAAFANSPSNECGFSIILPQLVQVKRDLEAQPPLCQFLQIGNEPSPFVNGISILPWSTVEKLSTSDSARIAGFFRLLPHRKILYEGRRSYSDSSRGYQQILIGKQKLNRGTVDGKTKITARSNLKVTWLQPLDSKTQEETTDSFECIDVALSNLEQVVFLNWCSKKGTGEVAAIAKAVATLSFGSK